MKYRNDLVCRETEIKVSILCATYNHEKYIEKTLQGFVNQITDFRYEIIVHEDASTDNTKSIVRKYVNMYPDLFVPIYETENQYSKGYGVIYPIMYAKARGKYIALCEGDDYWSDEHKLQKQYEALENNPDCSICVHKAKAIWADGRPFDQTFVRLERGRVVKIGYHIQPGVIEKKHIADAIWLQGGYPFHTSSYFIRKCVIEDLYKEKTNFIKYMNADLAHLRLCVLYGNFYYIDEIMSHRRRGVDGSYNDRWKDTDVQLKIKHWESQRIGEIMFDEYSNHQFHDYISIMCFNLIAECCVHDTGNLKKYRKYIKETPLSIAVIREKGNLWMYIRYLIILLSPQLYHMLYKIRVKLMKKQISPLGTQ